MPPNSYSQLLLFLKDELKLSPNSISMVQRSFEQNPGPVPMILWQYGLVTLDELDRIYDWLETVYS